MRVDKIFNVHLMARKYIVIVICFIYICFIDLIPEQNSELGHNLS